MSASLRWKRTGRFSATLTSVNTQKPAIDEHLKTGQR